MTAATEFSRPVRLDTLGERPVERAIEADEPERAALAARFDLLALERLEGRFAIARQAGGVVVTGEVDADVRQSCVVSGEPVATRIREAVDLRFVREAAPDEADEIELAGQDLDTLPLEGESIDLGEIAAETMALALPPFPRADDAALAEARRSLLSEEEAARLSAAANNPFAKLKRQD